MKSALFVLSSILTSLVVHAETTYYVSAEYGSDENDGQSWETATASIQKAISISSDDDRIVVSNGVYAPISFGKRLIESLNGPEQTIIDGNMSTRCVTGAGTNLSQIVGFTIRNGHALLGSGLTKTTARNCVISNNVYRYFMVVGSAMNYNSPYGGGADQSALYSCVLTRNEALRGGGAYQSILEDCLIFDNKAVGYLKSSQPEEREGYGGGASDCTLVRCIVQKNYAISRGGGTDDSILCDCLVANNRTSENSWHLGAAGSNNGTSYNTTFAINRCGSSSYDINGTANNCILTSAGANPAKRSYCLIVDETDFVSPTDFHLKPSEKWIDCGDFAYLQSNIDLEGNPRISRRGLDIGCYEYPIPIEPEFVINNGNRFVGNEKSFSIVSDNTNGVLYYAIDDGEFVSAGAQSVTLTTDKTIRVRAYVLAYDRFQSEIVEADIVKVEPCAVVEGGTATWNEAETEVTVAWKEQPEAFTYTVYRGTEDDFDAATQLTNGLETCSFVDEPGDPDAVWFYWVVGENELGAGQVGDSVATRWAQVATPTISPEDGTRFGTASKKVMFTCATAGVKFYYTTNGSDPTTNSPTASAFTLKDTAMVKVIAVKSRMRPSEVASATITRIRVAEPPTLGAVVREGAGLSIAWGAVDEAESYEVFRGRSPDFAAALSLGETPDSGWTDATAEAGVPYYYFVVSKNIAGTSDAGAPALGATLTLSTAVNAPQLVFATGAECPWTAFATNGAADGAHQATSGTPDDSAESWLETSVTGPGQITFLWKSSCEKDDTGDCEWDHLAFRLDGEDLVRLDGRTKWEEVSVPIPAGEHVLRWVYAKDEGMAEGDDCGSLDCVQWISDETKGDWEKWIDNYGLLTDSGYEALKPLPSGKGDTLYEEFMAGLNPLDPLSRFRARIDASVVPPVISWNPDLGESRTYTVEGKQRLTDQTWGEPEEDSRFFRIIVEDVSHE